MTCKCKRPGHDCVMADDCRVVERGLKRMLRSPEPLTADDIQLVRQLLQISEATIKEAGCTYLTVWIHGTVEAEEKPCGEVDILNFSGYKIDTDFISWLLGLSGEDLVILLAGLPTEQWLRVEVYPIYEGFEIGMVVKGYHEELFE